PASALLPELLGDRNRHLGHFEQFVGRDRRLAPFLDGTQEGRSTIVLPLVLSPGALPAEPGPVESLQREEVVELQRAPGREHLDPLLRHRSPSMGEVMDRAYRAVGTAERDASLVHGDRHLAVRAHAPTTERREA